MGPLTAPLLWGAGMETAAQGKEACHFRSLSLHRLLSTITELWNLLPEDGRQVNCGRFTGALCIWLQGRTYS